MAQRNYDHDVEQIRRAIHDPTGSRASIMVGAGFSFNARKRHASVRSFPSWSELAESLVTRLYPNDEAARRSALKNTGATSGALRLAQEFEAAFGRTVLLNHVRNLIPDREHEPGHLHEDLLNLHWADVFTTNYDTLLERAADPLREQRYEVVRCVSDLPLKRAPRIVKLHGTLPALDGCILTEEDYRTYPERFGPFVAEVQVSMVETHLCLIGFSGDDPNFLAWSGWVRDRMGNHTPPIYLWTFNEPTTFQLRMLEQRSVIPLPMCVITDEEDHANALQKFLEKLERKPEVNLPRWCLPRHLTTELVLDDPDFPSTNPSSEVWWKTAIAWHNARQSYPEWMIPHVKAIESMWGKTQRWAEHASDNPPALSEVDEPTCIFMHFELLWRLRKSLFPAYDTLATTTWDKLLERYVIWRTQPHPTRISIGVGTSSFEVDLAQIDIAATELQLERIRHAREIGDFERFNDLVRQLNERLPLNPSWHRAHAEHFLIYQRALACLSFWDDDELTKLLTEWNTDAAPLWALRRAGLMIEAGNEKTGESLLTKALKTLRSIADEGTAETWSIEAWIRLVLRHLKRLSAIEPEYPVEQKGSRMYSDEVIFQPMADQRIKVPLEETKQSTFSDGEANRERKGALAWLRDRSCDPEETLEWIESQNSYDVINVVLSQRHSFDSRTWSNTLHTDRRKTDDRIVAAYRLLRLVEDAGLPLRARNIYIMTGLAREAIQFLTPQNAREATGAVLRMRTQNMVAHWFTRWRIAVLPVAEIQRLRDASIELIRRLSAETQQLLPNSIKLGTFEAACDLLSRVVIRETDQTRKQLLSYILDLAARARLWERSSLGSTLIVLLKRICDGLSPTALSELVPTLLRIPFPDSPTFPSLKSHGSWIDPLGAWGSELLQKPSLSQDVSTSIDDVITRVLAIANDESLKSERRCHILRLVTLVDQEWITPSQLQRFSKALYTRTDSITGLPIDTGCFDSVVLMAPPVDQVNEHNLFSAKYITTPWPADLNQLMSLLGSLARTGPITKHSGRRLRAIRWTAAEIAEIASRCRSTIANCAVEVRQNRELGNEGSLLQRIMRTGIGQVEEVAKSVANVIDEVLLVRRNLAPKVLESIIESLTDATDAGLPVLIAYPKLASLRRQFASELAERIVSLLCGNDDQVINGFTALNHWANQLKNERIPRIPDTVTAAVNGLLSGDYSPGLIHAFDTLRNLASCLSLRKGAQLLRRCEPAISKWARRLVYNADARIQQTQPRMTDELPDLRAAMTRLCVASKRRNLASAAMERWLESVRADSMPEIRRALAE